VWLLWLIATSCTKGRSLVCAVGQVAATLETATPATCPNSWLASGHPVQWCHLPGLQSTSQWLRVWLGVCTPINKLTAAGRSRVLLAVFEKGCQVVAECLPSCDTGLVLPSFQTASSVEGLCVVHGD
jgi:hypothetical protein